MLLSMTAACGDDTSADSTASAAQGSASVSNNTADENKDGTSTLTFKGITFKIAGDFEEKAVKDDAAAYVNDTFSVSVNYHGETSKETQEELVRSNAKSLQKSYPDSTVEVLKNESSGMFYYTMTGTDMDHATCDYIVDGVYLSFITSNSSEEALNTISSIEFED